MRRRKQKWRLVRYSSQKKISCNQFPYHMLCEGWKWVVGKERKESLRRFNKTLWWGQRSAHKYYMRAEGRERKCWCKESTDKVGMLALMGLQLCLVSECFSIHCNTLFITERSSPVKHTPMRHAVTLPRASLCALALTSSVRLMFFTAWVLAVWRNEWTALRILCCLEQGWFG